MTGIVGPDPDGAGALKHRAVRLSYSPLGQPMLTEQGTVNSQSDADWGGFAALAKQESLYDVHGRPRLVRVFDGAAVASLSIGVQN